MPTIKVKTVYIEKLKALNVYDAWLSNVKAQFKGTHTGAHVSLQKLHDCFTWHDFIDWSFHWEKTPEKDDFWRNIQSR